MVRRLKREFVEDEDSLFLSKDKVKNEPVPSDSQGDEGEGSEEEQSEDDEDHLHALDEQIQERLEGFDCPYDPTTEALPSHPAFHTGFTQVEHEYADIIQKAVDHLQSAKYQNTETARLAVMGSSIKDIKYSSGTKVALIGNSGVGTVPRS